MTETTTTSPEKPEKPEQPREIIPHTQQQEIVLQGDPEAQLQFAQKAAKALMSVVNQKEKKVMMGGKQYLEYGDWQTLARFYGATVGTEWTKPIMSSDGMKCHGYEARAQVFRGGEVISAAEAMCTRDEPKWGSRPKYEYRNGRREKIGEELVPEFQLRSMAQTRAAAKALRNALGWVAELAGYASTPAEEIDADAEQPRTPPKQTPPAKPDILPQHKIVFLLETKLQAVPPVEAKKEDYEKAVMELTKLKLVPENYQEIVSRLEIVVKERAEAKEVKPAKVSETEIQYPAEKEEEIQMDPPPEDETPPWHRERKS